MKISEHFTVEEAAFSRSAVVKRIKNEPTDKEIQNIKKTAEIILEPVRKYFRTPFRPNSFFRSKKLNRRIGGSKNSAHMTGCAVDIEVPKIDNYYLAEFVKDKTKATKVILEHYVKNSPTSGWVHCEFIEGRKKAAYTAIDRKRARKLGIKPPSMAYGLRKKIWYIPRSLQVELKIKNMIRHYDITFKKCPKYYVLSKSEWAVLKEKTYTFLDKYNEENN